MKSVRFAIPLLIVFLSLPALSLSGTEEDDKRLAGEDMEWIEKRQEKVQEFVGQKKRDCVRPFMQPLAIGLPQMEYCGKEAEEYRRNHPLEMKFQKWLDGLF